MAPIEIIDLFAGPGGLGEGFSQLKRDGKNAFKICISIEKEKYAHETLLLRSFVRQFERPPTEYYQYLHGKIQKNELFEAYPSQHFLASREAWRAELGGDGFPHSTVVKRIKKQISNPENLIVIGGPPCQAYSLVGRSKMGKSDDFENDPRHTLYKEYLKIIAEFKPAVFVMENVKGIISSKLNGEYIFDKILTDLERPRLILNPKRKRFRDDEKYTVFSLVNNASPKELTRKDFTIKCEEFGVPQKRHRVILVAVRNDMVGRPRVLETVKKEMTVEDAISDLPKLRSGLSRQKDSDEAWQRSIGFKEERDKSYTDLTRGAEYIESKGVIKINRKWYYDKNLRGVINHTTRSHIASDLNRYYYIAKFGEKFNQSPKLQDLPKRLLPNHKNVKKAIKGKSLFNDRFRVQLRKKAASTITSHISKDGHYFIHYDPKQCRSLTVREAARIQTFPDNYKFEGPRTAQYQQVGNAVPPLLAFKIANIISELFERNSSDS